MTPPKFKPGDYVRIVVAGAEPSLFNTKAQVKAARSVYSVVGAPLPLVGYCLDTLNGERFAREEWLRPWYDGWDKSTWDTGAWRPNGARSKTPSNSENRRTAQEIAFDLVRHGFFRRGIV